MRILMVCLGNICRSPMADGHLRKKVKDLNLDVYVDSAGTSKLHKGEAPDYRMIAIAAKFGTPIDDLRARQFTLNDFKDFDLIYCMDLPNKRNVLALARTAEDRQKVRLILNELKPNADLAVPDPYYGSMADFEAVYELLDKATDCVIEKIKDGKIR
jgi:protein-tyrosine phosphatase